MVKAAKSTEVKYHENILNFQSDYERENPITKKDGLINILIAQREKFIANISELEKKKEGGVQVDLEKEKEKLATLEVSLQNLKSATLLDSTDQYIQKRDVKIEQIRSQF